MKSLNRIMVVIDANEDFSDAPDGLPIELRKALRLVSSKADTEIKLISVGYERYLSSSFRSIGYDYVKMKQDYLDRLGQTMEDLVAHLCEDGYQITCQTGWAHPRYELIVEMAQEFGADLLIQHCRPNAQIEHFHLTHDSWELVRHCPVPLLLVKDRNWGDRITLMAAVDPLHDHNKPLNLDDDILHAAAVITNATGGEFHAVHAYAGTARPFAAADKVKQEHETAFNELMSKHGIDEAHRHLLDESPIDALKHYGEKINSDMVIMGAISRSRIVEALIGSTAEGVLDYVKTDILIVKPAAES